MKIISNNPKAFFFAGLLVILVSATVTYTYLSGIRAKDIGNLNNNNPKVLAAQTESTSGNIDENLNFENEEDLYQDPTSLNVLLLGYGGAGHSGGFLTDVIQVIHFNFEKQKIAFISIPRDLWVQLPSGTSNKINKAFTLGNRENPIESGAKVTAQMAEVTTGLKINNFISVDFVGFKRAIGYELDGITVNVPETLDDPWYPVRGLEQETCGKTPEEVAELTQQLSGFQLEKQFECRYEHIHFDKGINYMEGGDALAYVRSRHGSAGGDFDRSQRQQALLLAIRDKLFKLDALNNIPGFFKQMIAHTDTNLDIDAIKRLAPLLIKSKDYEVSNITLSTQNVFNNSKSSSGQYIIVPKTGTNNWGEVKNYVESELAK